VITLHDPVAAAGLPDDPLDVCALAGVVPVPVPLVVEGDEPHAARAATAASAAAVFPILTAAILIATSPSIAR